MANKYAYCVIKPQDMAAQYRVCLLNNVKGVKAAFGLPKFIDGNNATDVEKILCRLQAAEDIMEVLNLGAFLPLVKPERCYSSLVVWFDQGLDEPAFADWVRTWSLLLVDTEVKGMIVSKKFETHVLKEMRRLEKTIFTMLDKKIAATLEPDLVASN